MFVFEQKKYDRYGLIDASTTYITRMFVNKQEMKHKFFNINSFYFDFTKF